MTTATTSHTGPGALPAIERLARRSVAIIAAGQAGSGAYVASPNFPVYRYSWFRDGAFIADAMSRAGHPAGAEAFFGWCARVLVDRSERIARLVERRERGERIEPEELLHCRYTLDGDEAPEHWWNFQLDGYGAWLWALEQHSFRYERPIAPYQAAVEACVRYLVAFWDEPSYDWWEEHIGEVHTSSLASVYGGLSAASRMAVRDGVRRIAAEAAGTIRETVLTRAVHRGAFAKWIGADAVDASLIVCSTPFALVAPDDPLMDATVQRLEGGLAHGGVHRYALDTYYGGGEWVLLAALLGWHYAERGRTADAWAQLEWVCAQATPEGELPEQVGTHLLFPEREAEWVARWGPVATPLLWSHAMFLTLALELGAATTPVVPLA